MYKHKVGVEVKGGGGDEKIILYYDISPNQHWYIYRSINGLEGMTVANLL